MFGPQIAALKYNLKASARRATWSALGGLLIVIGLLFFGIAIWVVLERALGLLPALVIVGLVFVLLGFVLRSVARYPARAVPRQPAAPVHDPMAAPPLSAASIINAVVMGIAAGRSMRRRD